MPNSPTLPSQIPRPYRGKFLDPTGKFLDPTDTDSSTLPANSSTLPSQIPRLLRLYPNVDSEDFKQNRAATFRKYPLYRARRAQISFLRSYAQRDHREEVVRKHIEAARQIGGGVTDSVVIGVGTSETTFMISRKDMAETVLEEHSDGKHDLSNPSDLDTACLHLADSWDPPRGSYGLSDNDVVNVFLGAPWGSAVKAGRSNRLLDNCPSDKVYLPSNRLAA